MFPEEKAYQEQISSLNTMVIELQEELFFQKQNIQTLENDLVEIYGDPFKNYKLFFDESPSSIIILDHFGKLKNLNTEALNFFETKKYLLLENSLRQFLDHVVFHEFTLQFYNFLNNEEEKSTIFHFLQLKNQKSFSMVLTKLPSKNIHHPDLIIGALHPYSKEDSQSSNYLSHIVLDQLRDGVVITNEKAEILRVNNAFIEITGYNAKEVIGKTPRVLKSNRHTHSFYRQMWHEITHHGWWSGEIWNKRKNGEVFPEWLQINRVIEPITKRVFYTSIFSDISERKKRQSELDRLAHYDTLTGLVNRHFLQVSLTNLLEKSKTKENINALLFLDLDHFKQINDVYGHQEGDLLLQEAAQRILATVRSNDIVARVGGDEFIIVLSRLQHTKEAHKIASHLISAIREPFYINNNEHTIGVSIGIALSPLHGTDMGELMSRADSAMYRSKNLGRNQVSVFQVEDEKYLQKKDTLKNLILQTIKNPKKHLQIYYQPIIHLKDNSVSSIEALLRVQDSKKEFINPEDIIHTAESEGLIFELGEVIFEQVCQFHRYNLDNNLKPLPVSINLSVMQLTKKEFVNSFKRICEKYKLNLKDFNFEITETRAMENLENLYNTINKLISLGSNISLDDFGTGYASLAQLHNLPINIVKIDKSFTFRIDTDEQAKNMVNAMILMTHGLNCKIVIEGVETKESLEWLKQMNADYVQGYYFSKPLDEKAVRDKYLS